MWVALSTHLMVRVRPPGHGLETQLGTRSLVQPFDTGSHPRPTSQMPLRRRYWPCQVWFDQSGDGNQCPTFPAILPTGQAHQGHACGGLGHRSTSETGLARTSAWSLRRHIHYLGCFCAIDSIVFCVTLWVYDPPKWARRSSGSDESVTVP